MSVEVGPARVDALRRLAAARGTVGLSVACAVSAAVLVTTACTAPAPAPAPRSVSVSVWVRSLEEVGARAAHTATRLEDGRTLVAGGCVVDGCSRATSDTFVVSADGRSASAGPPMTTARTSHCAAPLPNGDVLVVGGFPGENAGVSGSVEVFDAATQDLRSLEPLSTPRGGHACVALADGRVLVIGGWVAPRTYTGALEVIDPLTAAVEPGVALPWAADALEATPLQDGRVLVTGGQVASGRATARAATFDPDEGAWTDVAPMGTPRRKHVAVPLPDGRVLVAGGTTDDETLLATTELFDPRTGTFTPGPRMREGRYKLPGGALAVDGRRVLFAAGGSSVEVLDVVDGTSRTIADLGSRASFATVTRLLGGRLLVLGGYDENIALGRRAIVVEPPGPDLR